MDYQVDAMLGVKVLPLSFLIQSRPVHGHFFGLDKKN